MIKYEVHKGVGRQLELFGLRSIYIFLLPAVVAIAIVIFFIMTIKGCTTILSLAVSLLFSIFSVTAVLIANKRYAKEGLIKELVSRHIPRTIKIDKRVLR